MLLAFRQSRTKCRSSAKLSFFSFPGTFCRMFAAASHIILYVNAGKEGQVGRQSYLATAHDKSTGRRPAFSFTRGKGFGAKKKLVARILKSEPLILKSKPLIFCPLKTRPAGAGDQWPFGHKTVCLLAPKMQTKRRHGRDESCIYGERQAG